MGRFTGIISINALSLWSYDNFPCFSHQNSPTSLPFLKNTERHRTCQPSLDPWDTRHRRQGPKARDVSSTRFGCSARHIHGTRSSDSSFNGDFWVRSWWFNVDIWWSIVILWFYGDSWDPSISRQQIKRLQGIVCSQNKDLRWFQMI